MLQDKAMLVTLSISKFSPRKTDKKVTADVLLQHNAGQDAGKFVKALLPEGAMEKLKELEGEARKFHYENTLPWSDEGDRILPTAHYLEYTEAIRRRRETWDAEVEIFLAGYDDFVEQAKGKLNGMFNQGDYPTKSKIRSKFSFESNYTPMPSGADFRVDLPGEEIEKLRTSVDAQVSDAAEHARQDLWKRLADPVKTMVERLSNPDGRIYDSLVGNLRDIVALIPALNLTDDPHLEEIRKLVLADLTPSEPDTLRKDKEARSQAAQRAQEILDKMSAYMPATIPAPLALAQAA